MNKTWHAFIDALGLHEHKTVRHTAKRKSSRKMMKTSKMSKSRSKKRR